MATFKDIISHTSPDSRDECFKAVHALEQKTRCTFIFRVGATYWSHKRNQSGILFGSYFRKILTTIKSQVINSS